MKLKDIPIIVGVDKVHIYRNNELLSTEWTNGARMQWFFSEDTLAPYVDCEVDYLEMSTSESSETIICDIWLKLEKLLTK